MDIRFFGTGGAFSPHLGNSAAVVDTGAGTHTLIDAGCTTYSDLCRTGWINRITHVVITHLHDDHAGSLGSIINHRYHVSGSPVTLLYPTWLQEPLFTLLRLQRTSYPVENFANMQQMEPAGSTVGDSTIQPIDTSSLHQDNMPSAAYILRSLGGTIAYSGDLGDSEVLFNALSSDDKTRTLVFHDASFEDRGRSSHVNYRELYKHLDAGWKIYIYHNDPAQKPADCRLPLVAQSPEFKAVVL
jgi:ribonuclease BN (tRNA processing enzyme)